MASTDNNKKPLALRYCSTCHAMATAQEYRTVERADSQGFRHEFAVCWVCDRDTPVETLDNILAEHIEAYDKEYRRQDYLMRNGLPPYAHD